MLAKFLNTISKFTQVSGDHDQRKEGSSTERKDSHLQSDSETLKYRKGNRSKRQLRSGRSRSKSQSPEKSPLKKRRHWEEKPSTPSVSEVFNLIVVYSVGVMMSGLHRVLSYLMMLGLHRVLCHPLYSLCVA